MALVKALSITSTGGQTETSVRYQPCGLTQVSDAAYQALVTDVSIAFVKLTAARTVTLPLSTALPDPTQILRVLDASGACSATNTITVQPYSASGSDTIAGGVTPTMESPYQWLDFILAASGLWIFR